MKSVENRIARLRQRGLMPPAGTPLRKPALQTPKEKVAPEPAVVPDPAPAIDRPSAQERDLKSLP
ncbi:hypothetical protein ACXWP3_09620, partial [Streptococcus pyogenes]